MYVILCVLPSALKLGHVTNFNMLFLVMMGFICLVDEVKFMLMSSYNLQVYTGTLNFCMKFPVFQLRWQDWDVQARNGWAFSGVFGSNMEVRWYPHLPLPLPPNYKPGWTLI